MNKTIDSGWSRGGSEPFALYWPHSCMRMHFRPEFRQTYPPRPVSVSVRTSGLNVIIPRVFGVGVGAGLRMWSMSGIISSGVFDVWRIMDFGRRSWPDRPKTRMRENITDDLLIFDKREVLGLLADYVSKSCIYPIILILLSTRKKSTFFNYSPTPFVTPSMLHGIAS